ncbi:MAG: hypothetical protein K9N55_21460, partial [Phycisphaerae bacterium]|nr:hypothetical protein [Phycisphaerae bacterium]
MQSLPLLVTTPEVTVNPGDLLRGTTYYWQVVAITADADASVSDIWSFSTPAIKATKPTPADGAVELLNPVALSWAAPQGAVEYAVYLSDDAVIDEADLLGSGEAVEYALPELNLGKTYYWRVDTTHEDL